MTDISDALRPGVYILRRNGRVVFVGQGKSPLARIYAHTAHRRGQVVPQWMPTRPIDFDEVEVIPCRIDLLDVTQQRVQDEVGWTQPSTVTPLPTRRRA